MTEPSMTETVQDDLRNHLVHLTSEIESRTAEAERYEKLATETRLAAARLIDKRARYEQAIDILEKTRP